MNTDQAPLALFGGSFNPPHYGHIYPLISAANEFDLQRIHLLPTPNPAHKKIIGASFQQRVEMLDLVCNEFPLFTVDLIESQLPSPSYTIQTLRHLRAQEGARSIVFIMGQDSLHSIDQWHQWDAIIELCNILVLPRQDCTAEPSERITQWITVHHQSDKQQLHTATHGQLFFAESPITEVSSTAIRNMLTQSDSGDGIQQMLPRNVYQYCLRHNLYN
ncbi:nicotinate-nucleotide adenylyltransferase [Alteromonas flava]|uniref:nicotinate-nucleotide adenylyltransferase n=1 Tax=Alteromonas flava TaxID=2048003 RepID=UPI000C281309|nr:nicotinate-nucleotide adenylyltransferase [Alteromonas flava]